MKKIKLIAFILLFVVSFFTLTSCKRNYYVELKNDAATNLSLLSKNIDLKKVSQNELLSFKVLLDEKIIETFTINGEDYSQKLDNNIFTFELKQNTIIDLVLKDKVYKVNLNKDEVYCDEAVDLTKVTKNTLLHFHLKDKPHHTIQSVYVNNNPISDITNNTFTLTIHGDTNIKVNYSVNNYKLITSEFVTTNSSINPDSIPALTELNFQILKKEHLELDKLLINDTDQTELVNNYQFSFTVTSDTKIEATYKTTFYKVTFDVENLELTTTNINLNQITPLQELSFRIIEKEHHQVADVLLNNASILTSVSNNTFKFIVKSNSELKVVYEENRYQLQLLSQSLILITPGINLESILPNQELEFRIDLPSHHHLTSLEFNNSDIQADVSNNTFKIVIIKNSTLNAGFTENLYQLTINSPEIQLLTSNINLNEIKPETQVQFKLTKPDEHYTLTDLLANNESILNLLQNDLFTITVTTNTVLSALYTQNKYNVNIQDNTIKLLTQDVDINKIVPHTLLEFELQYTDDFALSSIIVNDEAIDLLTVVISNKKFSLEVTRSFSIRATFTEKINYQVTYSPSSLELLTPGIHITKVEPNTVLEFKLLIPQHYEVESFFQNDVDIKNQINTQNNTIRLLITQHTNLNPVYKEKRYQITSNLVLSVITPNVNILQIKPLTSVVIKLSLPEHYHLGILLVNGVEKINDLQADNTITLFVDQNLELNGELLIDRYQVTIGENITLLTPNIDLQYVAHNEVLEFELTRDDNFYKFTNLYINDETKNQLVNNFKFQVKIESEITIRAEYEITDIAFTNIGDKFKVTNRYELALATDLLDQLEISYQLRNDLVLENFTYTISDKYSFEINKEQNKIIFKALGNSDEVITLKVQINGNVIDLNTRVSISTSPEFTKFQELLNFKNGFDYLKYITLIDEINLDTLRAIAEHHDYILQADEKFTNTDMKIHETIPEKINLGFMSLPLNLVLPMGFRILLDSGNFSSSATEEFKQQIEQLKNLRDSLKSEETLFLKLLMDLRQIDETLSQEKNLLKRLKDFLTFAKLIKPLLDNINEVQGQLNLYNQITTKIEQVNNRPSEQYLADAITISEIENLISQLQEIKNKTNNLQDQINTVNSQDYKLVVQQLLQVVTIFQEKGYDISQIARPNNVISQLLAYSEFLVKFLTLVAKHPDYYKNKGSIGKAHDIAVQVAENINKVLPTDEAKQQAVDMVVNLNNQYKNPENKTNFDNLVLSIYNNIKGDNLLSILDKLKTF